RLLPRAARSARAGAGAHELRRAERLRHGPAGRPCRPAAGLARRATARVRLHPRRPLGRHRRPAAGPRGGGGGDPGAVRPRLAGTDAPEGVRRRAAGRALHPTLGAGRARAWTQRPERDRAVSSNGEADARPLRGADQTARRPDRARRWAQPGGAGGPHQLREGVRGGARGGAGVRRGWLERVAWTVIVLALIPAAVLAVRRVASEGARERVAMVMDEQALADLGALVGLTSFELGTRLQALGLTGVALYEDTIESLVAKGAAAAMLGSELRAQALARGEPPPAVPSDATLVTALAPGALDGLIDKNVPRARPIEITGRTWFVWPGDVRTTLPAGPDIAEIDRWRRAGFDVAYRPRNAPYALTAAGEDFPAGASYLVYAGTQVAGHPGDPASVIEGSQPFLTAVIEG